MPSNHHWTRIDVPDQSGRIAIVTGANSGIGYETARALAWKGATTVIACRDMKKADTAAERIRTEQVQGSVEVMPLDLADLASVRRFADSFRASYHRLDLLINNAGVMAPPSRMETADGFELQLGTNHLGHFALTGLLLNEILASLTARVVVVINFDDLQATQSYESVLAYGQSKLANLLFAFELQRRFKAAGAEAIAVAAHPGWTATNLQRYWRMVLRLNPLLAQQPDMGSLPILYAATAPDVSGGDYFGPGGFMELRGAPRKVRPSSRARDQAVAAKLWAVSEELTGVRYSAMEA
jgi:NAD(P)-dependent dehydrogenase (short-subunit alcohol dehydrogenase family)